MFVNTVHRTAKSCAISCSNSNYIPSILFKNRISWFPGFIKNTTNISTTAKIMNNRPKVLVTRPDIPQIAFQILEKHCDLIVWEKKEAIPKEELLSKIKGVDGVYCLLTDQIGEKVLEAAGPQLKVVGTMSVGLDHLDLKALKARGIKVGYTPGILTEAVTEITIGLLLATSRRFFESHNAMLRGEWKSWSPTWMCGPQLRNSTVGIVGLGRIGMRVAECLKSFQVARILYTSRTEKATTFGGLKVDFQTLLKESDFVIVIVALTPETREMFDKKAFETMKKTAVFINVSRGDVVHQPSLIEALKNGTIRAAGLDVMTPEPIPLDNELLQLDNCVVLPHIGSAATETREEMGKVTAENILAVLQGTPEKMPIPYPL